MDVPHRAIFSPPPAYDRYTRDDISEVETITDSTGTSSSPVYRSRQRSYSVASEEVLPREDIYGSHSRDSSGSSGKHPYTTHTGGLITPPGSAFRQYPPVNTDPANGRSTSLSYFSITETDDPAVYASLPRSTPQSPSIFSQPALRSPTRSQTSQRTSPPSPMNLRNGVPPLNPQMLPYNCVFQLQQNGSMILAPFEGLVDHGLMYIIETYPNPFTPTSYITTVYRRNKELVACFEMGISKDEPTLFFGQTCGPLKDVFARFRKDRWRWQRGEYKLHWDVRNEREILCYTEDDPDRISLARFRPAATQPPEAFFPRLPVTTLEINTNNPALLDEIVVSALVVERKRTNPVEGSHNKDLFN